MTIGGAPRERKPTLFETGAAPEIEAAFAPETRVETGVR